MNKICNKTGKQIFNSLNDAYFTINKNKQHQKRKTPVPYKCEFCGLYHLTSHSKNVKTFRKRNH